MRVCVCVYGGAHLAYLNVLNGPGPREKPSSNSSLLSMKHRYRIPSAIPLTPNKNSFSEHHSKWTTADGSALSRASFTAINRTSDTMGLFNAYISSRKVQYNKYTNQYVSLQIFLFQLLLSSFLAFHFDWGVPRFSPVFNCFFF